MSLVQALRPERTAVEPEVVRAAFGAYPSGVAALCAEVDGVKVGMVASSFSVGASYEPPIVMFSVQRSSTTWPVLRQARSIGVSVLTEQHGDACMQLASRSRDRFEGLAFSTSPEGALLLDEAAMQLETSILQVVPAGDHEVVLLEVTGLSVDHDASPLVYRSRSFHGLRAAG